MEKTDAQIRLASGREVPEAEVNSFINQVSEWQICTIYSNLLKNLGKKTNAQVSPKAFLSQVARR